MALPRMHGPSRGALRKCFDPFHGHTPEQFHEGQRYQTTGDVPRAFYRLDSSLHGSVPEAIKERSQQTNRPRPLDTPRRYFAAPSSRLQLDIWCVSLRSRIGTLTYPPKTQPAITGVSRFRLVGEYISPPS